MPIYEYRCVANGHRFELLRQIGSSAPACPVCGGDAVRVFTPIGVIFKGAGFHTTDYRRPSPNGTDSSDKTGKTAPASAASEKAAPARAAPDKAGDAGPPAPAASKSET